MNYIHAFVIYKQTREHGAPPRVRSSAEKRNSDAGVSTGASIDIGVRMTPETPVDISEDRDMANATGDGAVNPPPLETHRNVVRRFDRRIAAAYGRAGVVAIVVMLAIVAIGWSQSMLTWWPLWILTGTAGLVTLLVARRPVRRSVEASYRDILSYCEANHVEPEQLRAYYQKDEHYEFFVSMLDRRLGDERRLHASAPDDREADR